MIPAQATTRCANALSVERGENNRRDMYAAAYQAQTICTWYAADLCPC
jgi:hypothetical protein